jgi:hypothetical protein
MDLLTAPADLIDRLDPGAIRERLEDLDRQAAALRVLLRAALARRREETLGDRRASSQEASRAS